MERKNKKLQYVWVIVALCALMIFTCLGFCSSTNSLFINKVTEHLGAEDMTERFFADYNRSTPEHPMAAPVGVDYVFAVRE
jgi:hypothetical protein